MHLLPSLIPKKDYLKSSTLCNGNVTFPMNLFLYPTTQGFEKFKNWICERDHIVK